MLTSSNVLLLCPPALLAEELQRRLPKNCSLKIASAWEGADVLNLVRDVDVLVTTRASRQLINAAPRLKMIQTIGTGVDKIDIDTATARGVLVCSAVGLNAIPVAEHAMALLLALAKNLTLLDSKIRREGWVMLPRLLLNRKTVGIVGLGSVGVEVAKRAKAFNMRVLALKRNPSEDLKRKLGLDFLGDQTTLPYLLAESDFLVLSIVLTPETKNLIGAREFKQMKRSAYLVNVSRGGIVDEEALIDALRTGVIAGAGLDVFAMEPINRDNLLLTLDNTVLTPHAAGGAGEEEQMQDRAEFIAHNVEQLITGKKLEKIVDPQLKYVLD